MNVVNFRDDALMFGILEHPYQTFTEEYSFLPPRLCALSSELFQTVLTLLMIYMHEVEGWKTHLHVICEDIGLEKSNYKL